ncbi:MAG: DJ-1/PfpI family protein [Hyphomicrobiaceae bacterium]
MTITKRDLLFAAAAAVVAGSTRPTTANAAAEAPHPSAGHDMTAMPAHWHGNEKIAMVVYPEFTALDLVAPQYCFNALMGAQVLLVAKSREPVRSDTGLVFVPDLTFAECTTDLDILFVPGGSTGTLKAMEDEATIAFLKDRGARAKWITSVCTGSLVLGVAGLLNGYKATSHWAARDILRSLGADPVAARYVIDRNRITGAGVTAGMDFGLAIVARLRDDEYAQTVQLLAEYDPKPPFTSGSPATASPASRDMLIEMFKTFQVDAKRIADAAVKRF